MYTRYSLSTLLTIGLVLATPNFGKADVTIKNDTKNDIWIAYCVMHRVSDIGETDSTINGGWTIKPGQSERVYSGSKIVSFWLHIGTRNCQHDPANIETFAVDQNNTFIVHRPKFSLWLCEVPKSANLSNRYMPKWKDDKAYTVSGHEVEELPRFQIHFDSYNRTQTLTDSIKKKGKHVFFKTKLSGVGGTFTFK